MNNPNKKVLSIEVSKALGIIFIVLGHSGPPWIIEKALYSFHMPFWFYLSGYLYKRKNSFNLLIKNKFRGLIVPYLIIAICTLVIFNLNQILWHQNFSNLLEQIVGIFMADRQTHLKFNGPLWYLPALFSIFMLNSFFEILIKKILFRRIIVAILSIFFTFCLFEECHGYIPFGLDTAIVCILFFYLGLILQDFDAFIEKNKNIIFFLSMLIWFLVFWVSRNNYFVIAYASIKPLVIFYLLGITGIFSVISGSKIITNFLIRYSYLYVFKKILHCLLLLGGWSFGIYLLHKPMTDIFCKQIIQLFIENNINILFMFRFLAGIFYPLILLSILKKKYPYVTELTLGGRIG